MSKRSSKVAVAALLIAVLVVGVTACGPKPAPTSEAPGATVPTQVGATEPSATKAPAAEKKNLTIITLTGPRYQFATEGMVKEYMKLHPDVTIKVEAFPHEEYVNKMAMEVAGKGKTYDLVWIDYKFIGGWADAGYLLPIDKYFEANADWWKDLQEDNYPTVLNMYQYKDHWWAVPNDGNTELFYYRKDLLEKAGVSLPKTWDEVLEAAKKLHNPPEVYAIGGNFARFWATDFWLSMFFSGGGEIWDKDFKPQINTPAGIEAAKKFLELAKYAPKEATQWEEADVYEAMGSAGIIAMAPAQWGGAVLTNPELSKLADKIATGLVPSLDPEGKQRVLPMGGFGLGINASTPYPDVAFDFLKFYVSRENQRMYVSYTGQPARVSALQDPENLKIAPYLAAEAENLQFAKPRPVIAEYAKAEQIIGVELDEMLQGRKTPEQAMADASLTLEQELIKSGKLKQ